MARIQRPGARIIGTKREWEKNNRYVLPDAVPIMILWPFSAIRLVYELEDTGPPLERDALADPFAVQGEFRTAFMSRLASNLKKQKGFKIKIEGRRQGYNRAGSAAAQGNLWNLQTERIGRFAAEHGKSHSIETQARVPAFRITVNDRLQPGERFITVAHELAHIFCGHLGGCTSPSNRQDDEGGWPDRRHVGVSEREIEAEATAFLVAARAGLVANSARYLAAHASGADMKQVSVELVARAAARIERLSNIHYGRMVF